MSTYGAARYRVAKEVPGVDPVLIDGYLIDRYTSILDKLKWRRLDASAVLTTIADLSLYSLPADCRILNGIESSNGPLPRFTGTQLAEYAQTTGEPRAYAPYMDDSSNNPPRMQVKLYPAPDAEYSLLITYTAEAPTPTGTSTALLPWMRPSALIAGACADALEHVENYNRSDRQNAKFLQYLGDMLRTEALARGSQPLKQSEWLTRHNQARVLRSLRTRLP